MHKECGGCGGRGFFLCRIKDENENIINYQRECGACNGFGILMRDPENDSKKGLAYRKIRGLFS